MKKIITIALLILLVGCSSVSKKEEAFQEQTQKVQESWVELQKIKLSKSTILIECPNGCGEGFKMSYTDPRDSNIGAMPMPKRETNGWDAVISVAPVLAKVVLPVLIHGQTTDALENVAAQTAAVAIAGIGGAGTVNTVDAGGDAMFGDSNSTDSSANDSSDQSTSDSSTSDSSDSSTSDSSQTTTTTTTETTETTETTTTTSDDSVITDTI